VRIRAALPLLLLLCLLAPASASASYVRMSSDFGHTAIWYDQGRPEQNDVSVSQEGTTVTFHDNGATLDGVSEPCERLDDHTARCTAPDGTTIQTFVHTYDGDDRVVNLNATGVAIAGGSGNDTLSTDVAGTLDGGGGKDVLTGSPGDDTLIGAQGDDQLFGRAGNDSLAGDAGYFWMTRGDDIIDGGPGVDTVYYSFRLGAVHVDLRRTGRQGARDENDVLTGLEGVETSGGADRIIAPVSEVQCGARLDEVIRPDAETLIGGDCERTRMVPSLVALTGRWTLRANNVFSLPLLSRRRCDAWVALFSPGFGRVGHVMVPLRRGREAVARMQLAERGRVRVTVRDCGPLLTFSLQL
jgi:hypothetical protein